MLHIKDLKESFENFTDKITDKRTNNKRHLFAEMMFLILTAVIYGYEGWRSIESFGQEKNDFFKRIFPFKHRIPSDARLRRFFTLFQSKRISSFFYDLDKKV
jgi:thermostable 8-oxoguanine DNA glycosylase